MRLIEGDTLEKETQKFEYSKGIYEGEAIDNIPNGKGKLVSGKDCFYEGEFLNGSFHGNGKFFVMVMDASKENGLIIRLSKVRPATFYL